jgi:hypothetical protein
MSVMSRILEPLKHKGFFSVVALSIVSLISLLPLLFSGDDINEYKVDIYLLSDHLRYPENIAYDISEIVSIIIFIFTIQVLVPHRAYKRYVMCFFIASVLSAVGYFLFYSQYVSLFLIPILLILIVCAYIVNKNEEGNYTR